MINVYIIVTICSDEYGRQPQYLMIDDDTSIKLTEYIGEALQFNQERIAQDYLLMLDQNKKLNGFNYIRSYKIECHYIKN